MSARILCDVCGIVIKDTDAINVFRMWNLPVASVVTTEGLSHAAYDEDYYLCDRCFNGLMDRVEEMREQ